MIPGTERFGMKLAKELCPVRFVVIATMVRGRLDAPELLDDANQWRALSAWRVDESRCVRTEFEQRYQDAQVVWKQGRRVG